MKDEPLLFIVSAPSGAGKSTLICKAIENLPKLRLSVSYTTRSTRDYEKDGVDYHFIDNRTFDRMIAEGRFLEWTSIHGNRYGTAIDEIQQAKTDEVDLIFEIEGKGAYQVMDAYPDAISIFVIPPSMENLRAQLIGRKTEDSDQIHKRLANAKKELEYLPRYQYVIVNDVLNQAVQNLEAIIRCHRLKSYKQQDAINKLLSDR